MEGHTQKRFAAWSMLVFVAALPPTWSAAQQPPESTPWFPPVQTEPYTASAPLGRASNPNPSAPYTPPTIRPPALAPTPPPNAPDALPPANLPASPAEPRPSLAAATRPAAAAASFPVDASIAATGEDATTEATPPAFRPPDVFPPSTIVASVNGQPILAGDVEGLVNQSLPPNAAQASESELLAFKRNLFRRILKGRIELKLLYLEFERGLPPEAPATAIGEIWGRVYAMYEEQQLAVDIESKNVSNAIQLDAHYRSFGWSLAKEKRLFGERNLGQAAVLRQMDRNPEVTFDEMLQHYRENSEQFTSAARARWEQLSVHFERTPDRAAAMREIAEMGNEVFFGTPLAAVAKRRSHDYRADQGGVHDWTTQGSLRSQPLDEAIFSLPLQRLSTIIEDDRGLHIIRVLERDPAVTIPFIESQIQIRDQLRDAKRDQQFKDVAQEMKNRATIWTIFDDADADP